MSMTRVRAESGFSMIELLVATGLLLVVSSIVTTALMQMTNAQKTIWNRTEMHSGIRGATELLQQEVGQAGRITLPSGTIAIVSNPVTGVSVAGMWAGATDGILLTFLDGNNTETVRVTGLNTATNQITACFRRNHGVNAPVRALGGFPTGIIPPGPNGSSATILKMH